MEGITKNTKRPGYEYSHARDSVAAMYRAGIPILCGIDSNASPGVPAKTPHGESLHDELELLVDAGLPTVEVFRAAISLPAKYFGLEDRGVIDPGRRADLLLSTRMQSRIFVQPARKGGFGVAGSNALRVPAESSSSYKPIRFKKVP